MGEDLESKDTYNLKIIQDKSGKKIKKIYHSADIHIRVIKRHVEYRLVFDNLFETLRKNASGESPEQARNENVFVICGDIFHSRDKFAAETLGVFDYLINGLSKIMDVVIIAGNHDTHINNSRLDIISGIINIKDYPGVFYLKNSGYYGYNNVLFGVSSLVDGKFCPFSAEMSTGFDLTVALFHGGTNGAITDSGMLCNNGINQGLFEGFDLVMLGDYHKRQFIGVSKTIAYPGSLVQQNFGEDIEKGILEWGVVQKNAKFLKVINDYAFVNLHDTELNDIDKFKFSKFSRIRLIRSIIKGSTEKSLEQKIRKKLSKKTEILSFISSWKGSNSSNFSSISQDPDNNDLQEKEIQKVNESWLTKTFDSYSIEKYKGEFLEKIKKINLEILESVFSKELENTESDLGIKSKSWRLKTLKFKNMYIYGEDKENILDFEKDKGITGILAENASGKTSLINILLYSILGSITKSKSLINRNIVNKNSKKYSVSVEIYLEDSGDSLIINREGRVRTRKGKQDSMDETLKIFLKRKVQKDVSFDNVPSEFTMEEITTNEKIKTQNKINEILGVSREEILSSVIINNTSSKSSIFVNGSELYNFLCELFEMNVFDNISDEINKKIKETNSKIQDFSSKISGYAQVLNIDKNDSDQGTLGINDEITDLDLPLFTEDEKAVLSGTFSDKHQISLDNKLHFDLGNLKNYTSHERNFEEKIEKIKRFCNFKVQGNNSGACDVKFSYEAQGINYFIENSDRLLLEIKGLVSEKEIIEKPLVHFTDSGGLHHCISNEEILFANKTVEIYENTIKLIRSTEEDYIHKNTVLFVLDSTQSYSKAKELVNNIEAMKKIRHIDDSIHKLCQESCNFMSFALKLLKESKACLIKEILNSIRGKQKIIEKINSIKAKKVLTDEIQKLKQHSEKEITRYSSELEILKELKSLYGSSCIPKIFLEKGVDILQKKVNRILFPVSGLFMRINTDIDSKWEIFFEKNNGSINLGAEQISGFQRLVAEISMKTSILDIRNATLLKNPLFIVDETADCISEGNLETIDDLFYILRTKFHNVLFVSHNDYLKTKVDNNIVISTDYTNSSLV
jgi:DNA repair exonuclease SbcCD nuclease subunit/ribosomal protein S21